MGTPDRSVALLRNLEGPQRASFVELLFDVVFVFAFTRLGERLVEDLTWLGLYQVLLLVLAMWWVWYRMAWTTNRYDPERPVIQLTVIATMLGTLLMAAALPAAFDGSALVFAPVYVAIQVLRHLWLVLLGGDRYAQLVSVRILAWATVSAVPWIIGMFTQGSARMVLWSLAVLTDYLGGLLDFPTPRLGRAGLRGQKVAEEHLTERFRQVLIIAFGETILTSGIHFSPHAFERDRTFALVVAFIITVLLWQIYFYRAGELLPAAIVASKAQARVGELASYSHLIMVIGVAISGVGDTLIIREPVGHTRLSWLLVIVGGPVLFLTGRALLDYFVFSHVSASRPIGAILLAVVALTASALSPILIAVLVAAVLAGVAVSNVLSWRLFPRLPAPPFR